MSLIWATRGQRWGFRFLLDGGFADPLSAYDAAFSGLDSQSEVCMRLADSIALRFRDPLLRKDHAGRVISHDFVVFGALAAELSSVEAGVRIIWNQPQVSQRFSRIWDLAEPPQANQ